MEKNKEEERKMKRLEKTKVRAKKKVENEATPINEEARDFIRDLDQERDRRVAIEIGWVH